MIVQTERKSPSDFCKMLKKYNNIKWKAKGWCNMAEIWGQKKQFHSWRIPSTLSQPEVFWVSSTSVFQSLTQRVGRQIISAFCNQVILYSDKELNLNSIKNTFEVLIEILFETNHLQERVTAAEFTAWQMIDTIMVIENCQPTLVHAPLSVVAYVSWGTGAARSSRDDS